MLLKNIIFVLCFSFLTVNAQSESEKILGNWIATDNSVAVKIYHSNNEFRAKIFWFDEKLGSKVPMNLREDASNPVKELRNRKIIGMEILEGLQYNASQNSWDKGRIYDASSGRHWDSSATISKDGILKVRGFWKFKWIGKSMTFRKLK